LAAVQTDGLALAFVHTSLQGNLQIAVAAVRQNIHNWLYVPAASHKDVRMIVEESGTVLDDAVSLRHGERSKRWASPNRKRRRN